MKILITGASGFIGSFLATSLLNKGFQVVGIDSINNYYDIRLKEKRKELLIQYSNYAFYHLDICDKNAIFNIFADYRPDIVINLAAQAGVRYSIENPDAYVDSNLIVSVKT